MNNYQIINHYSLINYLKIEYIRLRHLHIFVIWYQIILRHIYYCTKKGQVEMSRLLGVNRLTTSRFTNMYQEVLRRAEHNLL